MNQQQRKQWLIKNQRKIKRNIECITKETSIFSMERGFYTKKDRERDKKFNEKSLKKAMKSYKEPQSNDEEVINDIDLSKYLSKIRYLENHEEMLVLFVSKDGVVKQKRYIGSFGHVAIPDKSKDKLFIKAKEMDAGLYFVHNHPVCLSASFSEGDCYYLHYELGQLSKKHKVKILDFAVVTIDDYKSIQSEGLKSVRKRAIEHRKKFHIDDILTPKQKEKQKQDAIALQQKLKEMIKKEHVKNKKKYG